MGDIVTSLFGYAIVNAEIPSGEGFHLYRIHVFESGQVKTVNRLQIWCITDMNEMNSNFDVDLLPDPPPLDVPEEQIEEVSKEEMLANEEIIKDDVPPTKRHFVMPPNEDNIVDCEAVKCNQLPNQLG